MTDTWYWSLLFFICLTNYTLCKTDTSLTWLRHTTDTREELFLMKNTCTSKCSITQPNTCTLYVTPWLRPDIFWTEADFIHHLGSAILSQNCWTGLRLPWSFPTKLTLLQDIHLGPVCMMSVLERWWNRELTLKCKLNCYHNVKPIKNPLGVSPRKGNIHIVCPRESWLQNKTSWTFYTAKICFLYEILVWIYM